MLSTNAEVTAHTAGHASPPRILVVEDEAVVAMDLEAQLQDMGYDVCGTVDNGLDAIAHAWDQRPDIILMDIVIKGDMDGVDTASHISHGLHIPVIFLTAYSDVATIERAAQTAAYGYLTKPFQPREIGATIEVVLFKAALERRLRESEQWFASTLRCVGDAVVATDMQGKVTFMNTAAEKLLGWQLDQAAGRDIAEVMQLQNAHGGMRPASPALQALRDGTVTGIDFGSLLVNRNGKKLPIDNSAAPIRDENDNMLGAVLVFRDVCERIAAEEKLRQSEERFRNAFDFAPVGMALLGLDNRFLQVNGAICAIFGRPETELIGRSQITFSEPGDLEHERAFLLEVLGGQSTSVQYEKRYRTREGKIVWTLVSASLLLQKNGREPLCYLLQVYDLTERKDAEYRLARLAHFDPLTGLANRAWLSDELERQIVMTRRHKGRLAVVFLDLDHFKNINDSLGHEAGDEVLQVVAAKLKASVREADALARLGGDEFVILLPDICTPEEALIVTEKVQLECAKPVRVAGQELCVAISMGISLFPDDAQDARALLRYADSALYYAKSEGRNNVQFYRPELTRQVEQRMQLSTGLRLAVARSEFVLYFQPIVSLVDGAPSGTEALIRWNHPTLGLLAPDSFIHLAEETGLSVQIGEWVIGEACREAARWPVNGHPPITVSVNITPRQFKAGTLVAIIKSALMDSGLDPERLCVEITEQLLLENSEKNLLIIAELKQLGVKIAIDDFGTGYSSLSYISRFGPNEIKIDISLVRGVAEDPRSAALVRAAIAMAHSLDISVVTEGVETEAQRAFLQREHCDMAQGYLYGKPYRAAEFDTWLRDRRSSS